MFKTIFGHRRPQEEINTEVGVLEASRLQQEGAQLIDVREVSEFVAGHAKGAINIPLSELARRLGEIRTDSPVLVICLCGARSRAAQKMIQHQNRTDVFNIRGGTSAWSSARLPME